MTFKMHDILFQPNVRPGPHQGSSRRSLRTHRMEFQTGHANVFEVWLITVYRRNLAPRRAKNMHFATHNLNSFFGGGTAISLKVEGRI